MCLPLQQVQMLASVLHRLAFSPNGWQVCCGRLHHLMRPAGAREGHRDGGSDVLWLYLASHCGVQEPEEGTEMEEEEIEELREALESDFELG